MLSSTYRNIFNDYVPPYISHEEAPETCHHDGTLGSVEDIVSRIINRLPSAPPTPPPRPRPGPLGPRPDVPTPPPSP
ncbi:uncharacterized protein CTRU02_206852 [Colletotrichum truncatum]|uniref:Uncharacterized protein n=1 Tax=Colletotrichum truncatum TaxID=5467 RepID=A0ACC3YYZ3_COLTU|nr:uncharacterized protein CTRU02_14832 [Colletotrichum truncatum]KAF6781735.1 hypothetical protein CTRU02_14832 [Colletotrichum truncatum]